MKPMIDRRLPLGLLIFLNLISIGVAQDNPLDMARQFPPQMVKTTDVAVEQMKWRLQQLTNTLIQHKKMRDEVDAKIDALNDRINDLAQSLPIELRYASSEVRSQLIGDVLSELLANRLEVASRETAIDQLESALAKSSEKSTKVEELLERQHRIKMDGAMARLRQAELNYDRERSLFEKSLTSQEAIDKAKLTVELAKGELEATNLDFELEKSSGENEIADRLVEARIDCQPFKARVAVAEKFLKLFAESRDEIQAIEGFNRKIASLEEDRQQADRSIWKTKTEVMEIELLMAMTKSAADELNRKYPSPDTSNEGSDKRE